MHDPIHLHLVRVLLALLVLFPTTGCRGEDAERPITEGRTEFARASVLLALIADHPDTEMKGEIGELADIVKEPVRASYLRWLRARAFKQDILDPFLSDEELASCSEHPRNYIGMAMPRSLGQGMYDRAVSVFQQRLQASNPNIQKRAAWFLGNVLGAVASAGALVEAGNATLDPGVRLAVAKSLGLLGDARSTLLLEGYLQAEDPMIALRAARIWTDPMGISRPLDVRVIARLVSSDNKRIAWGALIDVDGWLERRLVVGDEGEIEGLLEKLINIGETGSNVVAAKAIDAVAGGISYLDTDRRREALRRLWGRFQNGTPDLKVKLVRLAAALKTTETPACLTQALHNGDRNVVILAAAKVGLLYDKGVGALPRLEELLDRGDAQISRTAALSILRILGKIKAAPEGNVVEMAREALKRGQHHGPEN